MIRAVRVFLRAASVCAGLALAILAAATLAAVVPRPLWAVAEPGTGAGTGRHVLVLANPIHTDIALPLDAEMLARFGFLREAGLPIDEPGAQWIVVGWGGRSFYLETPSWADLKPGPALRALTIDRSVLHITVAGDIDPRQPGVLSLDLAESGFASMLDAIEISFARNQGGVPQLIEGRSYGAYDRFYEATGWFNAFAGCNVWSAWVLREAGLRTGWWNPLPQSLMWSLLRHNPLNAQRFRVSSSSTSYP